MNHLFSLGIERERSWGTGAARFTDLWEKGSIPLLP